MTRFGAKSSSDTIEASTTNPGIIEIATQGETDTGTDSVRAVTPSTLANYSGLGGGGSGIAVEEDGVSEGTGIISLNFTTGLDVSVTGTEATISATGGGGTLPAPILVLFIGQPNTNTIWTNMPSALTEFMGGTMNRSGPDLTNATQARITVQIGVTAGSASAELRCQYSTDGSTWNYLDASSGPGVNISTSGMRKGSWVTLDSGAKADVILRVVGINGNGTADPMIGDIQVQVK